MFVTSLDVQKEFMFRHVSDFIPRVQDNDRRKIWDVSENWATPQNSPFKWEMVINHWILRVSLKKSDKPSCHSCRSPTPPRFQGSLHTRTQQSVDEGRPRKFGKQTLELGNVGNWPLKLEIMGKYRLKSVKSWENHGKSIGKYPVSDSAKMDMTMGRPSSCEIMA